MSEFYLNKLPDSTCIIVHVMELREGRTPECAVRRVWGGRKSGVVPTCSCDVMCGLCVELPVVVSD